MDHAPSVQPSPVSPRSTVPGEKKVIRLMSAKASREASKESKKTGSSLREAETKGASLSVEPKDRQRGQGNSSPELGMRSPENSLTLQSVTDAMNRRQHEWRQSQSMASKGKMSVKPPPDEIEKADGSPLAMVMSHMEHSIEQGRSLYKDTKKVPANQEDGGTRGGSKEGSKFSENPACPGVASLATMLEKLEKNFQTQKAMYKESMALVLEAVPESPKSVHYAEDSRQTDDRLVGAVEDLMCLASPEDLNMPPLVGRPVSTPASGSAAKRAKEQMQSFWSLLKSSVEESALCVLQNLYVNWQASFLEAVQEAASNTTRLRQRSPSQRSRRSATDKSEILNSPRSTVPCSPSAAARLIDIINTHTKGFSVPAAPGRSTELPARPRMRSTSREPARSTSLPMSTQPRTVVRSSSVPETDMPKQALASPYPMAIAFNQPAPMRTSNVTLTSEYCTQSHVQPRGRNLQAATSWRIGGVTQTPS